MTDLNEVPNDVACPSVGHLYHLSGRALVCFYIAKSVNRRLQNVTCGIFLVEWFVSCPKKRDANPSYRSPDGWVNMCVVV